MIELKWLEVYCLYHKIPELIIFLNEIYVSEEVEVKVYAECFISKLLYLIFLVVALDNDLSK